MGELRDKSKTGAETFKLTENRAKEGVESNMRERRGNAVNSPRSDSKTAAKEKVNAGVRRQGASGSENAPGDDDVHVDAAKRLGALGGASATEKLLGLDRRPSMPGTLVSPPGNIDFLRRLSPTMRRTMMRNMLQRQREKMKRLAGFLKKEMEAREGTSQDVSGTEMLAELGEISKLSRRNVDRSLGELGHSARMLDVLDELLAMQDHTISKMGTFAQG